MLGGWQLFTLTRDCVARTAPSAIRDSIIKCHHHWARPQFKRKIALFRRPGRSGGCAITSARFAHQRIIVFAADVARHLAYCRQCACCACALCMKHSPLTPMSNEPRTLAVIAPQRQYKLQHIELGAPANAHRPHFMYAYIRSRACVRIYAHRAYEIRTIRGNGSRPRPAPHSALGRAASSQPAVRSSWCQTIYVNARVHTHWRMLRPCQTVSAILYARYDCACMCVCARQCCAAHCLPPNPRWRWRRRQSVQAKCGPIFGRIFRVLCCVREMENTCGRCLFQCTSCVGELLWWGGIVDVLTNWALIDSRQSRKNSC